jgi:DNA processing protein
VHEVEKGTLLGYPVKSQLVIPKKDEMKQIAQKLVQQQVKVVAIGDNEYPEKLLQLSDPPPILYIKGTLEYDRPAIAVVGTRAYSHYGKSVLQSLIPAIAVSGITVVSGLAMGIDAIAHESTLSHNGYTIAVMGSGIDVVAPRQNYNLYQKLCANGCVVSEFVPGSEPTRYTFPKRNRIIAALADAVLIVEARERSGALITAEYAAEMGREVLAVPGSILSETSFGPNMLISSGAKLVMNQGDVLAEFGMKISSSKKESKDCTGLEPIHQEILNSMAKGNDTIDKLVDNLDHSSVEILRRVTELEINGMVSRAVDGILIRA